ncbi:hypothetical protein ZWY2020_036586 [Hordeum vulgare]|nr:hypothetical protein ZWY2020_036586 [Hordeum vulgare]
MASGDGVMENDPKPCAAVKGTQIMVENLFYNVVACRKTLQNSALQAYVETRLEGQTNSRSTNVELETRIKKQLQKPEFLPSSYDTAWVAMVPLAGHLKTPCFPQCVEWILQNQHGDGSWGITEYDLSADKNVMLSTLACVIALKKWKVGPEHITRGLNFIGRNFSTVINEQIDAPTGFNIIFPGMVQLAIEMGLEFSVTESSVCGILRRKEMEMERLAKDKSYGKEAYMAFVAEGLGNLVDWNEVMKFQRNNGSFFNSPSTTAAILVHNYDEKALQYLNLLVTKFGSSAVPTMYPQNIHCQLSIVDTLEKIGISRYFSTEIKDILDMTYSYWLQRDEEIRLDLETCAMAFRLLQMNGYDVSSDELSHVAKASTFSSSLQGYLHDTKCILELYKASEVNFSEDELILGYWPRKLLTKNLCSDGMQSISLSEEVEHALKFPFYATVEPVEHKRNIQNLDTRVPRMLKTKNLPHRVNQDLLALAIDDFRISQSIYQEELHHLESWAKENKLDQLQYVRKILTTSYLSAVAAISPHELSVARVRAKTIFLTIIFDDLFDVAGSKGELESLIGLVERWDEPHKDEEFFSERVKIAFFALYRTVNQLGSMASIVQNCDVTKHLVEQWLHLLRSEMTEAEWRRSQHAPTVEEYMTPAAVTFALGPIILTSQYFIGEKLSEHVAKSQDYNELLRLVSRCGRFMNDNRTSERDGRDGNLNCVVLLALHSGGSMSIEAAEQEIHNSMVSCTRDLLRSVLREDSVVPRPCREMFWRFCKTSHLFYFRSDEFTSPREIVGALNAVIHEPLKLQASRPSLVARPE